MIYQQLYHFKGTTNKIAFMCNVVTIYYLHFEFIGINIAVLL